VPQAAANRRWSLLSLLTPPGPPQLQLRSRLSPSDAAAAPSGIPPALNASLPGILQHWLSAAQEQPGLGGFRALFTLHSNAQAVAEVYLRHYEAAEERDRAREHRQQMQMVRRHLGGDADDGQLSSLEELLRRPGVTVINMGADGPRVQRCAAGVGVVSQLG
jgi:hypothetical protein